MSDELKAMLRQAPMNGFAVRTLAYIEKLEAQLAARCSADSAELEARLALADELMLPGGAHPYLGARKRAMIVAALRARAEPQASAGSGEEWNPTDEQVRSAAMWYRHDLGLLTVAEAAKVKTEARLWLRSWQKEVAALRAEPQASAVSAEPHYPSKLAQFYDAELANVTGQLFDALNEIKRLRNEPQSAGTESHSPVAMEGEKDTIVNLIHEHVGFEVLLAIESGVLTGVEKAAEAILAELGRRSQAESDATPSAPDVSTPAQRPPE
jgi:hypothetical protein